MTNHRTVLLAVLATVIAAFIMLYSLGSLLLAFGVSGFAAYTLLPVVKQVERVIPWHQRRPGLARTTAVVLVSLTILVAIAGALLLIVPPIVQQTSQFIQQFPEVFQRARMTIEGWNATYIDRIPEEVRGHVAEVASNAWAVVLGSVQNSLAQTVGIILTTFSLILGFAIAPLLIYYLVKDSETVQSGLLWPFPPAMKPHISSILDIANRTAGAYIRGQLILGLIVGTLVTIGLLLLGVPFPFLLGVVAGITELIPFIGPWIGGTVGVLVTLATAPHLVLWVILLYLSVQLLENMLLVPRIQGQSLNLHPVVVLLIITVGSQIWGLWGVILGPPVVALIKDLIVYFSEQWNLDRRTLVSGRGCGAGEKSSPAEEKQPSEDAAPEPGQRKP
ncbi:MAG TPA: AI-2E family transporter [Dehalococcoidia bacterium]|nr:AI-2E family transporter [Dehalococcoidia bacterium]